MASIKLKGDTSGELTIQAPSVAGTNTLNLPASSGTLATTAQASIGMKNRIINGNMAIDQRNAGASVTLATASYTLDRFVAIYTLASKYSIQQNAASVTPPVGFTNYLGVTSLSAYSVLSGELFDIRQRIEGYNIADLNWGTANAKTVTLSFWVRSSLTGTFGGAIKNSDSTRSYPFSYTISVANTWEKKIITIDGETTGTWLTTTGIGMQLIFGLGTGATYSGTAGAWAAANYTSSTGAVSVVGTSGATWYVTGVQLETGTTATDFEHLQYGQQLAMCQRYYTQMNNVAWSNNATSTYNGICLSLPNQMRATPTVTTFSTNTGTSGKIYYQDGGTDINSRVVTSGLDAVYAGSAGVSSNNGSNMYVKLTISSEL